MDQILGIPLAIDIGTFLGLLTTGAAAAGLTRWLRKKVRADAEAERERVRLATEKYDTHKEALEIHQSVTALDVFQAAERGDTDPAARRFLLATYKRGQSRYLAFKDSTAIDSHLELIVTEALADIADLFPAELKSEQKKVAVKHERRTNDRTEFLIGGEGPVSKHHALHVIERRFCELNRIRDRETFIQKFGAIVEEVVGGDVDGAEFTGETLLHDPTAASPAHQKRYRAREEKVLARFGAITLDGVDYLAGWWVGFGPTADTGRRVHLPIIEHFIAMPRYKDITRTKTETTSV